MTTSLRRGPHRLVGRHGSTLRLVTTLAICIALAAGCSVHRLGDEVAAGGGPGDTTAVTDPTTGETIPGLPGSTPEGTPVLDAQGNPVIGADGKPVFSAGPGSTVPSGPTTTAAERPPATNAPPGEARKASDRGVTADAMTLGLLAVDEGFFATLGAGNTKKAELVLQPFVDELNKQGGINGRKVVPKVSRYDPLSTDSMQAACVNQADDFKVFATLAQSGFYGDAEVCLANKQTPTLTFNTSSADTNYGREKGYVRQMNMNKDRNQKTWVDYMQSAGIYNAKTKPGLIYVDVPEDRQLVEKVILPYIKAKGLPAPKTFLLSASIAQTPSEAQSAVLQFKAANVDLVLPFVSFLRMQLFTEQAQASQYKPKYSVSDFGLLATDTTAGINAEQWDGTTGITNLLTGIDPIGTPKPRTAAFKECESVYNAGGQKLTPDPDDPSKPEAIELVNMMFVCQHVALFADAARRAGVNPTRLSYLKAIGDTGPWSKRVVLTEALSFAPNKYDGADTYQIIRWQKGCSSAGGCYRSIGAFRKSTH